MKITPPTNADAKIAKVVKSIVLSGRSFQARAEVKGVDVREPSCTLPTTTCGVGHATDGKWCRVYRRRR